MNCFTVNKYMKTCEKRGTRKLYIDVLCIIAIYMVLFNHSSKAGFMLFTVARDSELYFFYVLNSCFIKAGVPLFFMISGALLLNRNESIKYILKHRFTKYLIALSCASLITYIACCMFAKGYYPNPSVGDFLTLLFSYRIATAYWYLYAYLGFILMLPLLRKMAQSISDYCYIYIFVLHILLNFLSMIEYIVWQGDIVHSKYFNVFITIDYIFYPLMGYYIEHRIDNSFYKRKNVILILLLCVLSICLCGAMTHYRCVSINEWAESSCQNFMDSFVIVWAGGLFICAKYFFTNYSISDHISKAIETMGGVTFGIYLFERIWRHATYPIYEILTPIIHTLPACWLWILTACILGGAATFVMKKIPFIRGLL